MYGQNPSSIYNNGSSSILPIWRAKQGIHRRQDDRTVGIDNICSYRGGYGIYRTVLSI